jgi:hypothetical protein
MGTAFAHEASAEDMSAEERCSLVYVTPDCIDGPVARILMPPQGEPPLPQSPHFKGLRFTGKQRNYLESIQCDTWYPSWAADGTMYSSCTDGSLTDSSGRKTEMNSQWEGSEGWFRDLGTGSAAGQIPCPPSHRYGTTGNATLTGDDPFKLTVAALEPFRRVSPRYEGYYPCANFFHQGVWYYGGYYCHRWLNEHNVPITYELGGFGGFRISQDRGKTWQDTPHDDQHPLFPETGRCSGGAAIKMGTPHFVDFGRDLEHSPDGYAYLAGHGTYDLDGIANWCSGDAISMARVRPSLQSMNDPGAYEFYAGHDASNRPIWSKDFSRIAPLISWRGGAGCVNITYQPVLRRYFGFLCGGWADGDSGCYNIWVVESSTLTGPWFSVACLRGSGGGQPYFVCMPSKFNREDSGKLAIFYSANWSVYHPWKTIDRPGVSPWIDKNGPGGVYSLCVAEFELL